MFIIKEKFILKEQANFNIKDIIVLKVINKEELLIDLAIASNYTFKTFN